MNFDAAGSQHQPANSDREQATRSRSSVSGLRWTRAICRCLANKLGVARLGTGGRGDSRCAVIDWSADGMRLCSCPLMILDSSILPRRYRLWLVTRRRDPVDPISIHADIQMQAKPCRPAASRLEVILLAAQTTTAVHETSNFDAHLHCL